ncbi:MAG: very short patch repair endonuclease [Verrucomicrobia bacterium]|nr:very short patch repair endonuclease [Verrucomicrobiota bacterium]
MPDVFTKRKRSEVMSRIRGRGNKETELALMTLFRRHHISGWRRSRPVFGKPDFVFPKLKLAVFVDGCFWHSCPKHRTKPANNAAFWRKKLAANKARDGRVTRTLRRMGWRVVRIWEHELARKNETRLLTRLRREMGKKRGESGKGEEARVRRRVAQSRHG